MAKLEWKTPIEAVHGKLYSGFGAAKRKSANASGEQPNFSVMYGKRSTPYSQAEIDYQTKWGAIARMVALRRTNQQQKIADQAAFKAQTEYKTLTTFLWHLAAEEYNNPTSDND